MRAFVFGSFNPVTLAHLEIGNIASSKLKCNEVVYVPASKDYIKTYKGYQDNDILSDDVRISLLTQALKPYGYEVCTLEVTKELSGKTYDTIDYYGWEGGVTLCIGLDNLLGLPTWYRGKELLSKCSLMVMCSARVLVTEQEREVMREAQNSTLVIGDTFKKIRSTAVRDAYRCKDWDTIRRKVPYCVYQFLKENDNVFI